jgi:tRNA 2-selenouridine synthase SelU
MDKISSNDFRLSVKDFKKELLEDDVILLDVRTPTEIPIY